MSKPRIPDPRRRLLAAALPLVGLMACSSPRPEQTTRTEGVSAGGVRPPAGSGSPAAGATGAGAPPPTPPIPMRPPRLGLALGGGAARGFAHVGVLSVLERAGLSADVVAGTSAGSLVGALYASGMPVAQIRQAALSLDEGTLGDWTLSLRGLLRGKALQDIVNRLVAGRSIEDFPRRFAATAVDLYNGQLVLFRQGEAGLAVRASSAVPGVFEPVRVAGREYIDGGVASPVPVRTARTLGAEVVVAVDIAAQPRFQATDNMARVLSQTFTIMSQHLGRDELRAADVVITPAIGDLGSVEFGQRNLAIAEGERAAEAALPAIRAALAVLRPANT